MQLVYNTETGAIETITHPEFDTKAFFLNIEAKTPHSVQGFEKVLENGDWADVARFNKLVCELVAKGGINELRYGDWVNKLRPNPDTPAWPLKTRRKV
jgi:hypothetical protein